VFFDYLMMDTRIIKINECRPEKKFIKEASLIIKKGGLVAFPTETVYGLGADALNSFAVEKIFKAKKRPSDNPLIVHVSSIEQVNFLVREIGEEAKELMKKFWPGPLTLILKKSDLIPLSVCAGLDSVAVRMPKNKIALELIKESNCPIAAPSANSFSLPSPTKASHVYDDLKGEVELILDGGSCEIGLESTVLDLTVRPFLILRPGKITLSDLRKIGLDVEMYRFNKRNKDLGCRSPGMKYKHYSPKAKVILVKGNRLRVKEKIQEIINREKCEKVGVISHNNKTEYDAFKVFYLGSSLDKIASNLFRTFRECDSDSIDLILVEGVSEKGFGIAIMNRLKKASFEIINV
jgi:L-threonylcarbamoyladenylate synthase